MKAQKIIGAILILCGTAVLWFFTEFGFGNFAGYAGQAFGQSVIITLILLLLLAVTPLRKKTALILVIGIAWLGSTGTISFDLYKNGVKERETGRAAIELLDSFSSGKEISQTDDRSSTAPVVDLIKNYTSRVQKIHLEFANEINAAGLGNMLTPENLTNIQIAKQSLAKMTNLEKSVPKFESKLLEELSRVEFELSKSKDNTGQAAYKGFLETKNDGIMQVKKYFEIEKDILNTLGNILSFAIDRSGKLHLQNGQLLFEDQESLDLYNNLLAQLSSLNKQEAGLLSEQQQRMESTKTSIDKYL